ncbi:hypothetical protein GIB67_003238 [Kingdonia uniflora]|uniref:Polygalacturonase-inhibiting protein n=1 Tax=Kingdonia uniflora TaxID=39325 RepID=A0A7J7LGW4_9MAGN|nr:hypothetical protein GIB67_003238 [Kingdonia uniflora]
MSTTTTHLCLSLSLAFSLILLSSLPSPCLSKSCHPDDYKALKEILTSLNPHFVPPNKDCCNWYGFEDTCNLKSNRVTKFSIFAQTISGQIPSAIGDLSYLEFLQFHKLANLTGSIPKSITKLKNLKFLALSWLNLSGPIPEFLGELSNLEYIRLAFNQFSGSIPSSLSKLSKLEYLRLDRNQLTGSIPESFGHFKDGIYLYLSHNQLTGTIPKSFGNVDFWNIDLSRNKLVGDASMLFKPNGTTNSIDISRNLFEFDLSLVRFPISLGQLDINHNRISGSIPKQLADVKVQNFNASYNRLCGEIPLMHFDESAYIHNKCLCGPPLLAKCK